MSDLRRINGNYLEEKIKKGHRLPYFLKTTGSSEEELFCYIDKNFSSKAARSFKKRLKSKGKPQTKKTTVKEVTSKVLEKTIEIEPECEINHEPKKTALEVLLEKEALLSTELCNEEALHADKISQRAALKKKLKAQHQKMKELTEMIIQLQKDFETNVAEWNSIGDEMKSLSSSIAEKRSLLEEVRAEIDSMKKISMFVYSNGEIEFENKGDFDPTVDTEKVSELFRLLVQNESAESLTIKSIKQLARLLAIVEKLKDESMKFLIEFDETAMKEVFDIVSQN